MADRGRLIELKRELEWRKASKDPVYFFENHYKIKHPSRGMIPFQLRPAQREGLKHWQDNRYSLTLKARQLGWSTLAAGYSVWQTMFHPDKQIIMISRTEREAVDLLQKAKYGYKHLPHWLQQRGPTPLVDHQQRMIFDNDSSIISMPSANDPARGSSASIIFVDEWGFLPNAEEAWASIEPVADVGGQVIGLSTANGSGNFFHTMWVGSQNGTNAFKGYFAPWWADGVRDDAWYAEKKRTMLPWILAQEYPDNAEEAFIKSGRMVFEALDDIHPAEGVPGELVQISSLKDFRWSPNEDGKGDDPLEVWEEPIHGCGYVLGADVAEGLEWGDYSTAHVISVATGKVVAAYHGHVTADLFAEQLYMLGLWYNDALIGCESNNHGLTTLTGLRKLGYKRIYRRRRHNTVATSMSMEFGWATTKVTKPLMIDELGAALRESDIELLCFKTLAELKTYVRTDTGAMHGSPHDDRVISLAIANQMLKYAHAPEYRVVIDDYMTMGWWARQTHEDDGASTEWVIGRHASRR